MADHSSSTEFKGGELEKIYCQGGVGYKNIIETYEGIRLVLS